MNSRPSLVPSPHLSGARSHPAPAHPRLRARKLSLIAATLALSVFIAAPARALDLNANQLDDAWEQLFAASALTASADTDRDGFTNLAESNAGTNPFDPASFPRLLFTPLSAGTALRFDWSSALGKRYRLETSPTLGASAIWTTAQTLSGFGDPLSASFSRPGDTARFYRLSIDDTDTDADGLSDYAEYALNFNPYSANTGRYAQADLARVTATLNSANTITLSAIDPLLSENWPEPALIAVRRSGGLAALTVNLAYAGTATVNTDYTTSAATQIYFPPGIREVWITLTPLTDATSEGSETITVSLSPGTNYTLGSPASATVTLDEPTGLSAKDAARFLIQAAFGPDQDSDSDADHIPENIEELMSLGFTAWIDAQFARPIGYTQPMAAWAVANGNALQLYNDPKQIAWWGRAMGSPKLRPDDTATQLPDPLRQRVAFALSEILVISDRPEALAVEFEGMMNYYDLLETHAFGNYGDLLREVALHPCMGIYLSHLGNEKANPAARVYPDENFAREIMQLFSIGLWMLNADGTRQLDANSQPIPSYSNSDITELARVFTGLGMGGPSNNAFGRWPSAFTHPMKMWDAYHDCNAKTLLRGLTLPARTPTSGSTGTAGIADVTAAVDNLFRHPNTGPFIGRLLIQRLVTSNPSPAYVSRVSAAFADNGSGLRGDMKAVIKAILLDPEARSYAKTLEPTWGKLREPFLRVANFGRAFNATSPSGIYALDAFELDHGQRPLNSASVFNFFLPNHSPPGPITQAGLTAPEFQIINASTAISASNYYWDAVFNGLNRWGVSNAQYNVTLNLTQELAMVVPASQVNQDVPAGPAYDPDPLLRRLDLALTGGALSPQQFQIIRETLARIPRSNWQWHREYLRTAIYLIVTSPDFCVLR